MGKRLNQIRIRPFRRLKQRLAQRKRERRIAKKLNVVQPTQKVRFGRLRRAFEWVKRPLRFKWSLLGKLFRLLQRGWRGFRWMTRSLWFRLMGAFAVVIFLMLFIVMNVIGNATSFAFNQYVNQRNQTITANLSDLVDVEMIDGNRIEIVGDQIIIRTPLIVPSPPARRSERPNLPEFDEDLEIMIESIIEPVIAEEVITLPLITFPVTNSPESLGLSFLSQVEEAAQTAVIAAGIVSLILGTLIFRHITRPMSQMRRAAQALAAGEANVHVPVRSQDELGKVAEAFNQMSSKISEQEQMRRQMVADVAHELRTPLTVMNGNLEAMLDGLLTPNEEELLELHGEVQRLSRLIDDLRLLSLADSGQLSLTIEKVDVRELTASVVTRLTPLAETHGVRLVDDAPKRPLLVRSDAGRVQQALTNLVANGIRHTPAGGRVRVTAVKEKKTIHLSVVDNGPGIPAADLPYVFDRFWRGDKSRSRHSGGSGLGLAIVKQIAELHQGSVAALSPNDSGAIFTISLPSA